MTPTTDDRSDDSSLLELAPTKGARTTVELIRVLAERSEHAGYLRQLIDAETQRDQFDQDYRTARMFALSGKFDDIKGATPGQAIAAAMAKIRIGREWGMNESDSIAFIYFTNGRPAVMTEILATKIQQAGYGWDIEWSWVDAIDAKKKPWKRCTGCTLWLKRWNEAAKLYEPVLDRNHQPVSTWFTESDADHAMIYEKGGQKPLSEKWNFQSWGQDMYFWRAMSRLRKYYLTGVMRGAVQLELAREEQPPPTSALELAAPGEDSRAAEEPKPLRERILSGEQESLLSREPGEGE